jgi:predicted acyltransferase (DUF342 family)
VQLSGNARLFHSHCEIPPGAHVTNDLIVRGRLRIGAGARIDGSIKSHGDIDIGTGCVVRGAVVTRRNIQIHPACKIRGPVIAEFRITISPGSIIGTPRQPTTVTAAEIIVDSGVQISGTLWAHEHGHTSQQPAEAKL